jgi:hypothetical protein
MALYLAGEFENALRKGVQISEVHPDDPKVLSGLAGCCVFLKLWQQAVYFGVRCVAINPRDTHALDALSHASGMLGEWANVKAFGGAALSMRDAFFSQLPPQQASSPPFATTPPPPFQPKQELNAIAFSLFGENSKYCETAVINAKERSVIYPHWHCRFYVDSSVPQEIQNRLIVEGAMVIHVDDAKKQWPGPMWRFSALEDSTLDRILFRDADSIISERESGAVREWLASDQNFHVMRDAGSHTELMLAGLWGCTRGSLPPLGPLVAEFLARASHSNRFADQEFLRQYVWPRARENVLQHDSLFDFRNPRPFPDGPHRIESHTGFNASAAKLRIQIPGLDGQRVRWKIIDQSGPEPVEICAYNGILRGGELTINIPNRYAAKLESDYQIQITDLEQNPVLSTSRVNTPESAG